MSSDIWTRDELLASSIAIETTAWRVVEAQHRISTMKLADSLEDQEVLEQIIESTKPPIPADCRHLHYLLFTPFRYASENPYDSRFRRAGSVEGVFYAAASVETAIAEVAFYRLLFYAESPDTPLPTNPGEHTAFAVDIKAKPAVDLTRPPMSAHASLWMAPQNYTYCQDIGAAARKEGAQAICFSSVRDPKHRPNFAVLSPVAFAQPSPVLMQTWRIDIRRDGVLARCEAPTIGLSFTVADFAADTRLRAA
ncbi:MAG TPA: RES family NAD+ phosphorylase [Rhizomicrobium sp.]|jgi:hypothetical protein|nr:RES family NAD+ phosphorylase [Rhizomicrobium sp.]